MDLKEKLIEGEITSYSWLSMDKMWTDALTKEMKLPIGLENVILKNEMDLPQTLINQDKAVGT